MMKPIRLTAPPVLLLLLLFLDAGAQTSGSRQGYLLDLERQFELDLGPGWTILDAAHTPKVDGEAAAVARYDLETAYLAVEARRLPGIALKKWASAWGSVPAENLVSSMRRLFSARPYRVRASTRGKVDGKPFVIMSEFFRAHGWAFRISRYLPSYGPEKELRNRMRDAVKRFRVLAPQTLKAGSTRPPPPAKIPKRFLSSGAVIRDNVWGKPGVAATLEAPPGWEFVTAPDPTLFLPDGAEIMLRDPINKYQAGLFVLGDVRHQDDLMDRLRSFLGKRLSMPMDFRHYRLPGEERATCTSSMPERRIPSELPLSWIIQGRILQGQGIAVLVGVTGLGLEKDHLRMCRILKGLGTPRPGFLPDPPVPLRTGAILVPEEGFRLRLPVTWMPDPAPVVPKEAAACTLITAYRNGSLPSYGSIRAAQARVLRVMSPGSKALAALKVHLSKVWTRFTVLDRTGNDAARIRLRGILITEKGLEETAATLICQPGREAAVALITRTPETAADRLTREVTALHENFQPVPAGTPCNNADFLFQDRGTRIRGGEFQDTLRRLYFRAGTGWIWFVGDHAGSVNPGAIVLLHRMKSPVNLSLISERIPGFTVRQWAAYQHMRRLKPGPDGRYYSTTPGPEGRWKSILETREGWCNRMTIYLSERASPSEWTAAHAVIRTYRGLADSEVPKGEESGPSFLPSPESFPLLPPDHAYKNGRWALQGSLVSLLVPPGWQLLPIDDVGKDFPLEMVMTMEEPDHDFMAALIDLGPDPDLAAQGMRIEELFLKNMHAGEIIRPSHHIGKDIHIEAASEIPGPVPESSLPCRWLVRITRLGARTFAMFAWAKGTTLKYDRPALEKALKALETVPEGFWDHR